MKFRPYQKDAFDAVMVSLKAGLNPIVEIPTGGGKSIVIAKLAEAISPHYRVLVLAHRKELIQQNASKIKGDVGIYSAGLGRKDKTNRIIVAGIQSVFNKDLGDFDCVIVDECHLIPHGDSSMYQQLIQKLEPKRIIGFSATPYRSDSPDLPFFDHTCYNIGIKELIEGGFLSPLVSKISKEKPDLSKVPVQMGDYVKSKLADVMLDPDLLKETIQQIIYYGKERKSWLIFCVNVDHAEIVMQMLRDNYIDADCVHGKLDKETRDLAIDLFVHEQTQALTNCDVLTTGFDAPCVDMLVMLRPTESRSLYVQIVGRGTRLHEGKKDCLVLDFAGNINRHGTVTNLLPQTVKLPRGVSTEGYTHKTCPVCETVHELQARMCEECGHQFAEKRVITHDNKPADIDILGDGGAWYDVEAISYEKHGKQGKPSSLKITYLCYAQEFSSWYAIDSTSEWAAKRARKWVAENCLNYNGILDLDYLEQYQWREPAKIRVVPEGKYKKVTAYEY